MYHVAHRDIWPKHGVFFSDDILCVIEENMPVLFLCKEHLQPMKIQEEMHNLYCIFDSYFFSMLALYRKKYGLWKDLVIS